MKKEYELKTKTVLWDPAKCIHSGICAKGLPEVFQPRERPWIKTDNASEERVVEQVKACPSGALSMK